MRQAGALTVTQDSASCVVDGMPATARALGAARQTLSPSEMASLLASLARGARLGADAQSPTPHGQSNSASSVATAVGTSTSSGLAFST
jgi:hypothetical protein